MGMFRDLRDGFRNAGAAMEGAASYTAGVGSLDPAAYSGMVPGTATVVGIADTGMVVAESPVLELELDVAVPGRPPYRAKHRQVVAHAARGRFQPGSVLSVRVSLQDPNQLMLG
jgi:hypothetical protein